MTWTQLINLAPRLRWIYNNASSSSRITPRMIYDAVQLEYEGRLERGWAFERIWRKYDDMQSYRGFSDKQPGQDSWAEYQQVNVFIPDLAPAWWYYH